MAGEIIRQGDKTSHGGTVIEGSPSDICHGKAIAFIGHKTVCPQCKGNFPIIEGAPTTTFYGKGVALAGMKTACGAVLIASQLTDIVEHGGGNDGSAPARPVKSQSASNPNQKTTEITQSVSSADAFAFDLFFRVQHDDTGKNMPGVPYKITLDDGREFKGVTDENGNTQKVYSDSPQIAKIEAPYYDDSNSHAASESGSCGC
jgi:uncharacterized Zn-binding protein involved in type VI secretion